MKRAKGEDAFVKMLRLALEKGSNWKGNRRVEAPDVHIRTVEHVFGPRSYVRGGTIVCWYYASKVFAVDFERKLVTNYGMPGYSLSTGQNIRGWEDAFREMFWSAVDYNVFYRYANWSFSRGRSSAYETDTMFRRFIQHAPWVHVDADGVGWFHWPAWDEQLADVYFESRAFLRTSQNWRYFDYDWTEDGRWERKFIDDDAKRRWDAKHRRKGKHGLVPRAVPAAP